MGGKTEMTPRERMLAVYYGKPIDHPAVAAYPGCLPRGTVEEEVRRLGVGEVMIRNMVTTEIAPGWGSEINVLSKIKNADVKVDHYWKKGVRIERQIIDTPVGTVYQEFCFERNNITWGKKFLKYYITDIEDYRIMQYVVENTELMPRHDAFTRTKKGLGEGGVEMGVLSRSPYQKCLIEAAGPEQFLVDLYTDAEEVEALLQAMEEKEYEMLQMSLDTPADVFWLPENIHCDMTPPHFFEKYCLPVYQRWGKTISQTGKPFLAHADGKYKLLADMLAKSGLTGIESLSVPEMGGDLYLDEARALLPDMVLIPNFPSNLCYAREEEIVAFLEGQRDAAGDMPLMVELSENMPRDCWKRVLPIMCNVFNKG